MTPASDHPATWKFGFPIYHAESRDQLRTWLQENHASFRGLWLCSWRNQPDRTRCPYPEVVEEAICFGWIDSTMLLLDDKRGLQMLTPRKAKSSWSRLNRGRFAAMETAGLMTDAGRLAADAAKSNGWWTISDAVEDLVEPEILAKALDTNIPARQNWDSFPPSSRKAMLWWVVSAVREETQAVRVTTIVDQAELGLRAR